MQTAAIRYTVPPSPGGPSSLALAILVHGLLALLLIFGIHWQSQPPAVIQAELWNVLPQVSPQPREPPPPEPRKPVVEKEPPPVKPDIAVKVEKPKKDPPKPIEKPLPPKPIPPKPEVKPPPKPSQSVEELMARAGSPLKGPPTQSGLTGARGDPGYVDQIRAKILSNIRFPLPPDLTGNPRAEFIVDQLPTGEVISVRKTRSSGLPAFDAAVERAIQTASPLPKKKDGSVEKSLNLVFCPLAEVQCK